MTNQVPWNKIILEEFINLTLLTKDEEMILRTRIYGWTVREQADRLNMSVSSVNRIIKRIKNKYDEVEKYSAILPPRKSSEKEKRYRRVSISIPRVHFSNDPFDSQGKGKTKKKKKKTERVKKR